jgi:excisionase family DNA binding protein
MARDLSAVRFLTVAAVAHMMRVPKMTFYRRVPAGELPAIRFGRSFRVPESAVQAALNTHIADSDSAVDSAACLRVRSPSPVELAETAPPSRRIPIR